MKQTVIATTLGAVLGTAIGLSGYYATRPEPVAPQPAAGNFQTLTEQDLIAMYQGKPFPGQSDDYSCVAHPSLDDPHGLRALLLPCDVGGAP
jgi:hypothetical protein